MPLVTTFVRAAIGTVFVIAGLTQLLRHGAVVGAFARWGIAAPAISVWIVAATEIVCGALLACAVFTRPVALLLATIMIGAAVTAGRADGGFALVAPLVVFGGCVLVAWRAGREDSRMPLRPPGVQ